MQHTHGNSYTYGKVGTSIHSFCKKYCYSHIDTSPLSKI